MTRTRELGAIVLTGGRGIRLGGVAKASIEVDGVTLLERALSALDGVGEIVVVGDELPTSVPVTFVREDPAGGGPAAGLLTGLRAFRVVPEYLAVLAVDMPLVTAATLTRLRTALTRDGVMLADAAGRRQYLCAIYRTAALRAAAPPYEDENGYPVRRLVADLDTVAVPATGGEAHDVDSWDDLVDIRENWPT